MVCDRKSAIQGSFNAAATKYDISGTWVQKASAEKLAASLPKLPSGSRVLEIGCGTGFLTKYLLTLYPNAELHVTDIAPNMVDICQGKFANTHSNVYFYQMDGEQACHSSKFNLIASNMSFQWFVAAKQSISALRSLLTSDGLLIYSSVGTKNFCEWFEVLDLPELLNNKHYTDNVSIGVFYEEYRCVRYKSILDFLRLLKGAGMHQSLSLSDRLDVTTLRSAIKKYDQKAKRGALITWHILYSRLGAL